MSSQILEAYYKIAKKLSEKSGKYLSNIEIVKTLMGEYIGFIYNDSIIFYEDEEDLMLVQNKDYTDLNQIHEIASYEIEEI